MRTAIALIALGLVAIVNAGCNVESESIEIKKGSCSDEGLEIKAKNTNKNINDIRIGSGFGDDSCDESSDDDSNSRSNSRSKSKKYKSRSRGSSADTTREEWSNDDGESYDYDYAAPQPDLPEPTTTEAGPDPICYCQFYPEMENGTSTCEFPAFYVTQMMRQRNYRIDRAICSFAMSVNFESCTPEGTKAIYCWCESLNFEPRLFQVPQIPRDDPYCFDMRFKTCWRQCASSSEVQSREAFDDGMYYDGGLYDVYYNYDTTDLPYDYRGPKDYKRNRNYRNYRDGTFMGAAAPSEE